MRIGVLGDNHRLIDPALFEVLSGVDEIIHTGDLVTPEIINEIRSLASVSVVRGNNDHGPVLSALPEQLVLEREGLKLLVRHIVGVPGRIDRAAREAIARVRPRIVLMGHSHKPLAEESDGVVYLNPGSCGPRRFKLPRTAAVLELGETISFVVTDLDSRERVLETRFERVPGQSLEM